MYWKTINKWWPYIQYCEFMQQLNILPKNFTTRFTEISYKNIPATRVGSRHEMQHSTSGKWDMRQSFPCKVARCWNHQVFPRATGPCLTAVWTLKRGDNLISTHVNTTAGAKRKLWAYCVSVISSCILWPQEWKIFKWLWCPGSCWTALMVWKHLSPAFLDAHLPCVFILSSWACKWSKIVCVCTCASCLLCVQV